MKLKVCGMKHNLAEVAQLQPDYVGFIFYEKSPRDVTKLSFSDFVIPAQAGIHSQRVGVFVNASVEFILENTEAFKLDVIQLHGEETVEFCEALGRHSEFISESHEKKLLTIWKVFSIKDSFDFSILKEFEPYVDAFLFDTKGKDKGGNGYTFDWSVLKDYTSAIPFILSGGIGPEHVEDLKALQKTNLPILAIDVNSKFETKPGLKDIEKLRAFIEAMKTKNLMSH